MRATAPGGLAAFPMLLHSFVPAAFLCKSLPPVRKAKVNNAAYFKLISCKCDPDSSTAKPAELLLVHVSQFQTAHLQWLFYHLAGKCVSLLPSAQADMCVQLSANFPFPAPPGLAHTTATKALLDAVSELQFKPKTFSALRSKTERGTS